MIRYIRLLDAWSWFGHTARTCELCECNPECPCCIELADHKGFAACVPAGVYDARHCSACVDRLGL